MYFMATSSLVFLFLISLATPKFPDPMSFISSYFSIFFPFLCFFFGVYVVYVCAYVCVCVYMYINMGIKEEEEEEEESLKNWGEEKESDL